jgi:two-component system, response regulator YesN
MKLLVVDDEQYVRDTMSEDIPWKNYGIILVGVASTGREALEIITQYTPDVIISDIMMPDMTGLEMLKVLRDSGNSTPVIFLSGYSEFSYAREALQYGAANYLLKPCTDEEIVEALLDVKRQLIETVSKDFIELDIQSDKHVIKMACEIIQREISSGLTLTEVAEKVNMNASAFSRLFHQEMGCSFKKYITQAKISVAKKLLLESNMKIQEIANHLGYVSTSHFVYVFNKLSGKTPGNYRESQSG